MKNSRTLSKEKTYERIVKVSRSLIKQHGAISIKTIDIANKAGIAHGTLFSHFKTKELLISEIFRVEMHQVAQKLHALKLKTDMDLKTTLSKLLDYMSKDEDLFVIMAKEFPFYAVPIQDQILSTETIIRNIVFKSIEKEDKTQKKNPKSITTLLNFFFGTVNYYLSRKELFVSKSESVLQNKKNQLIQTFLKLTNHEKNL